MGTVDRQSLPTFCVIGVSKAGTTSLHHWMEEHPEIYLPREVKELQFFCYKPDNPAHQRGSAYQVRTLDAYQALYRDASGYRARGDVSTLYFTDGETPHRIRELIPDIKLLLSLRSPADRAISLAQYRLRDAGGSPDEVIALSRELAAGDLCLYASRLQHWLSVFPREQLHVMTFDQLTKQPQQTLSQVFGYIGVSDRVIAGVDVRHNPGGIVRSRFAHKALNSATLRRLRRFAPQPAFRAISKLRALNMTPVGELSPDDAKRFADLRRDLVARFAPDVVATGEILGMDLSAWTIPR